jgi:beta-aspartyl-peptidase (threonine type)
VLGGFILHGHHAGGQSAAAPASASDQDAAVRTAVESVIREQETAWNAGDIDAFVDYYWRDDNLTFSSGGKTTRGWTATRDRYRERYPTREKMGRVKFSNLEFTPLGDAAAMVLGEWNLDRDEEPIGGNFTLVFRKVDDRWLIIHDHTSRLAE